MLRGIGLSLERFKSFGLTLRVIPSSLLMSLRRTSFSSPLVTKKDRIKRSLFGAHGESVTLADILEVLVGLWAIGRILRA